MKKIIPLIVFLIAQTVFSQEINAENYFNYFANPAKVKGKKLTTAWVDKLEVAKILEDEMKKAGFEWVSSFRIVQVDKGRYANAICFSEKSKIGFVYEGSHNDFPDVAGRKIKSLYKEATGNDYSEKIVKLNGESEFVKFQELPDNFYILKEDPYWYQFTENPEDNKTLVTKEIMLEILKKDIREVISGFKK